MSFKLARLDAQSEPRTLTKAVDSATTSFNKGALLLRDAQDEWTEVGADPAEISAVALHGYGSDTAGFGGHGKKEFPPGYAVAVVARGNTFRGRYTGTLPAQPGGTFGVVRNADGDWLVDFTDTVAPRVKITKIYDVAPFDNANNEVEFQFLDANTTAGL